MWELWTDYLGLTALFYIWVCKYTMIFNSSNAYDKRFVPPRFKIFHWLTTSGTKSVGKKGVLVTGLGYLVELMLFIGNNYEAFNVFPRAADLLIYTIWISYAAWVLGGLFVLIAYLLGSMLVIVQLVCHLFHAARGQRVSTFIILCWVNIVFFCAIFFPLNFRTHGKYRIEVCGWIAAALTLLNFLVPVSRTTVIHTHNLEPMPLTPLIFFELSSIIWVVYGVVKKDTVILLYAYFWVLRHQTPFFRLGAAATASITRRLGAAATAKIRITRLFWSELEPATTASLTRFFFWSELHRRLGEPATTSSTTKFFWAELHRRLGEPATTANITKFFSAELHHRISTRGRATRITTTRVTSRK